MQALWPCLFRSVARRARPEKAEQDRRCCRWADRPTDRPTDRQTDRQTDRHTDGRTRKYRHALHQHQHRQRHQHQRGAGVLPAGHKWVTVTRQRPASQHNTEARHHRLIQRPDYHPPVPPPGRPAGCSHRQTGTGWCNLYQMTRGRGGGREGHISEHRRLQSAYMPT